MNWRDELRPRRGADPALTPTRCGCGHTRPAHDDDDQGACRVMICDCRVFTN